MRRVTSANYRKDKLYPRVTGAVNDILAQGTVVTPVAVLEKMSLLRKEDLERWRFGQVPYLEKVIKCNLSVASRILRILGLHGLARGLKPSQTVYMKWGKGPKRRLRFSKFGDRNLEQAYACHFVAGSPPDAAPS